MSDSSKFAGGDEGPINIPKELAAVDSRLPIHVDREMPLDITMRVVALGIAQRHVGDTVVREGGLYQQLKMDNKLGHTVSIDDVVRAALVFERYLWGQWSKGIAEQALQETSTELADALEKVMEEKLGPTGNDDPVQSSGGATP